MIVMSFRTFKIKVLVFTISNLLSIKIGGRHSTTDVPCKKYTIYCKQKTSVRVIFFQKMSYFFLLVTRVIEKAVI